MRHLRQDRGGEADVLRGRDGEEDIEPRFGGVQAGVKGVETEWVCAVAWKGGGA
jgi:hypothetical protein